MSNVKKIFSPLIDFLTENADKKVKTILADVEAMCQTKGAGSAVTTVLRNIDGVVTHVRCGFFKQWLPVNFVEFAVKPNTSSGFAPMSKEGTNLFSKRQRDYNKGRDLLLDQVVTGDLNPADLPGAIEKLEADRLSRPAHSLGVDTIDEASALTGPDYEAILAAEAEAAEVAQAESEDAAAASEG